MSITTTYSDFYDFSTSTDSLTEINLYMGGQFVKSRLASFFGSFRKYRMIGTRIRIVPASSLPADPGHISIEAGENTTDPLDILNVGIFKVWNGEPHTVGIPTVRQYNQMLMDKSYKKWSLQRGFSYFLRPKMWGIGSTIHGRYPNEYLFGGNPRSTTNIHSALEMNIGGSPRTISLQDPINQQGLDNDMAMYNTHKVNIGWLPTSEMSNIGLVGADVPLLQLCKIILPQARLTEFYFRMYVDVVVKFGVPNYQNLADTQQPYDSLGVDLLQGGDAFGPGGTGMNHAPWPYRLNPANKESVPTNLGGFAERSAMKMDVIQDDPNEQDYSDATIPSL